MKTLKVNYDQRSLYYSLDNGWLMQRKFNYRGSFWIHLSRKYLSPYTSLGG